MFWNRSRSSDNCFLGTTPHHKPAKAVEHDVWWGRFVVRVAGNFIRIPQGSRDGTAHTQLNLFEVCNGLDIETLAESRSALAVETLGASFHGGLFPCNYIVYYLLEQKQVLSTTSTQSNITRRQITKFRQEFLVQLAVVPSPHTISMVMHRHKHHMQNPSLQQVLATMLGALNIYWLHCELDKEPPASAQVTQSCHELLAWPESLLFLYPQGAWLMVTDLMLLALLSQRLLVKHHLQDATACLVFHDRSVHDVPCSGTSCLGFQV